MKKIIILLFSTFSVIASAEDVAPVSISKRSVVLNVDISPTNLKLSRADYSMPTVKVLVPELADVTIMNHRNTKEGAPCLATEDTFKPEDVIQGNSAVEKVEFTIELQRQVYKDDEKKTCMVYLVENVTGQIRGFNFSHQRDSEIGLRHIDDCR